MPLSLAEISDRLEIQDLLVRYTRAIDTQTFDALDAVFTPDATLDYTAVGGIRGTYAEVKGWLATVLPHFTATQHVIANPEIRVDGDRATSRVYVFNPMGSPGSEGRLALFFMGGYYVDELVRTPAGWRIARRTEELSWDDRHLR